MVSSILRTISVTLRVGGSLPTMDSGSAASNSLTHICLKYVWPKWNRNYKRLCIQSESLCVPNTIFVLQPLLENFHYEMRPVCRYGN